MNVEPNPPNPAIATGVALALAAALAFGVTTPIVQRAGAGVGPFATAFLLYAGATLATVPWLFRASDSPLTRRDLPRVALIALLGAAIAPTLYAWGMQRTSAISAAILLNAEATLTAIFAWLFYREYLGRRVFLALILMTAGGFVVFRASALGSFVGSTTGLAVLALGVIAWSLDSALARPLADRDASRVVAAKSGLGAAFTLALALSLRDHWPAWRPATVLLVCGFIGYGLSLRLYVLAQRRIGAARTASVFAAAPFIGAILAWGLGDREGTLSFGIAAAFFAAGTWLHLSERHHHAHVHESAFHEHLHRHDDGHHDHSHDVYHAGEHAHPHRHDHLEHAHEHGEDLHHRHRHG